MPSASAPAVEPNAGGACVFGGSAPPRERLPEPAESEAPASEAGTAARQILVVDDAAINLLLMSRLVEKRLPNCTVAAFGDSRQAIEWAEENDVDLAIVDYMMPGIDGLEFVKRFRHAPGKADTPLLMVTANVERKVRYAALAQGVNDFLNKPIDATEFVARAHNMLELGAGRKRLAARADSLAVEVEKATREILERERETLFCLGRAAEYRDPETGAHILRMAHYSQHVARNLGLPAEECDLVLHAAPMHDIGKLGIPDRILLKPGRLTPEESEIMKRHAAIGWEILRRSGSRALRAGAVIAHTHHEKYDGSGYPGGLKSEAIPLHGRIVAVADVFDALTSDRVYRKAWTVERAVARLREGSGAHFDPRCVAAFLERWDDVLAIRDRYSDEVE